MLKIIRAEEIRKNGRKIASQMPLDHLEVWERYRPGAAWYGCYSPVIYIHEPGDERIDIGG
jgi:hypothetical protein